MNEEKTTENIPNLPDFSIIRPKSEEEKEQQRHLMEERLKELPKLERQTVIENKRTWDKILDEAAIPKRYRKYTLESFQSITDENIRNTLKICIEYANNFKTYQQKGEGILMTGSPGRGKTSLACAIGMELLKEDNHKVYFVSMAKLYDINTKDVDKKDLVIIDDLGVEYIENENIQKKLSQIMIILNDNKTPIIVTTNLTPGDLILKYPPKIIDRILYQMTPKKLLMNGKSLRNKNNK